MNYRMVIYIIGQMMKVEGLLMFMPLITAIIYNESVLPFVIPIAVLLGVGLAVTVKPPKNKALRAREGFACVGLCWIVLSVFGALPFVISGSTVTFTDALFESVSGFTTTGVTTVRSFDEFSKSLLAWRCLTHWFGGIGVIMLFIVIMPQMNNGASYLFNAELPGAVAERTLPRIKESAALIVGIYAGFTIIEIFLLM